MENLARRIDEDRIKPGCLGIYWLAPAGFVFKTPAGLFRKNPSGRGNL